MADLLAALLLRHLSLHAGQHAGALPPKPLPAKQAVPAAVGDCLGLLLLMPLPGQHTLLQLVRLLGQERQPQHCYHSGAALAPA